MSPKYLIVPAIALAAGVTIAVIDSRPGWDDTGVSAAALFLSTAILATVSPRQWWLVALLTGAWIPLHGLLTGNVGAALAFVFAVVGSAIGGLTGSLGLGPDRRVASNGPPPRSDSGD